MLNLRSSRSHETPDQESRNRSVRWDIQGLRAFAVLAVVADHLFDYPRGGFVGVDIFFVISGFLISSHLLHQAENNGIEWLSFYRKRIKRIIPAAVLVLVVTVLASYSAFNPARADSVRTDSIWALLFGANVRMGNQGTDYFNASGPVSPLQHYWSLSIEEQFYFGWPILLLVVYFVLRRTAKHHQRLASGVVMSAVIAASFLWAVTETSNNATGAYFDTFARIWELGVGALLAVSVPLLHKIPAAIRPGLAWIGLAAMTASLWLVDSDRGFPAPWAALPVVATAIVIAAGTFPDRQTQQRYLFPLTNRVSNYVGDTSYSLYLWHFPIVVIGAATLGESTIDKLALLAGMFVVSHLSFELVEDPIRRSDWLTGRKGHAREWRPDAISLRWQNHGLVFLALVCALFIALAVNRPPAPVSALDSIQPATSDPSDVPEVVPPLLAVHQARIKDALSDRSWPDGLEPSMDDVVNSPQSPDEILQCAAKQAGPTGPDDCAWGPEGADKTAVLVGDSIALAYASPLRKATVDRGWRFLSRTATACPFVDLKVNEGLGNFNQYCEAIKDAAVRDINAAKPDVLFVVNFVWGAPDYPAAEYIAASDRQLAKVSGSVGRIVYVGAPPPMPNPAECYTPSSSPADCSGTPTDVWEAMNRTQQTIVDTHDGIWVETEPWYCYQRLCPPYVGKTPVRGDADHILLAYGDNIEPVIAESLAEARVFARAAAP